MLGTIRRQIQEWRSVYLDKLRYGSGRAFMEGFQSAASPGGVFLDAGCGEGRLREHLTDGVHYIGLDALAGDDGRGYRGWRHRPTLLADLHHVPLASESCDVVAMLHTLEHVREPQAVIRELARVMKPNATLHIAVPFAHKVHHAPNDYYRFTPFALEALIVAAELELVDIRPQGGYFRQLGAVLGNFNEVFTGADWRGKFIIGPLGLFIIPLRFIIARFEYLFDMFAPRQEFTPAYLCIARKAGTKQ